VAKVIVETDKDSEMLSIIVDGKQNFYGNYWDFDRPHDIIKLLSSIAEIEVKVVEKDMSNG
jgi:hypothetical protein